MSFRRLEELPVWNTAIELAVGIFDWLERGGVRGHSGLRDQLERAVISISNNIAEGYERGTHEEMITFLYYARGSAAEVRSMLGFLERAGEWQSERETIHEFTTLTLSASRQLGSWLESLKNSGNAGPRFQNQRTRQVADSIRRRDEFLGRIQEIQTQETSKPPSPSDSGLP
jgi:four helix bundle protein